MNFLFFRSLLEKPIIASGYLPGIPIRLLLDDVPKKGERGLAVQTEDDNLCETARLFLLKFYQDRCYYATNHGCNPLYNIDNALWLHMIGSYV